MYRGLFAPEFYRHKYFPQMHCHYMGFMLLSSHQLTGNTNLDKMYHRTTIFRSLVQYTEYYITENLIIKDNRY